VQKVRSSGDSLRVERSTKLEPKPPNHIDPGARVAASFEIERSSHWPEVVKRHPVRQPYCVCCKPNVSKLDDTLTLDVMPTEPALGFSNRWYPHAHRTATNHEISVAGMEPLRIRVISATSFIATKLVSYLDRGRGDRYHRDLEDIIVLVDGRPSLVDELEHEAAELRRYVAEEIARLLADDLEQYVPGHLPGDPGNQARVPIVMTRLRRIGNAM